MRPYTEDGVVVDATFSIETVNDAFAVVLESRAGATKGSEPRNPEYNKGLELLLARLTEMGADLVDALVDSTPARRVPEAQRRILAGPLRLDSTTNLVRLRADLGKAAAAVNRAPNAAGEGNRTKRLKLLVQIPDLPTRDEALLAAALARPSAALDVSDASVTGFLRSLIGVELTTLSGARTNRIVAVGAREVTASTARSPAGERVSLREVLAAMEQLKRQGFIEVSVDALGYRSAFVGAVLARLPGAQVIEGTPKRVVILDSDVAGTVRDTISTAIYGGEPGLFQGALDRSVNSWQRREQQRLRSVLLGGRAEACCSICGETYPARFLWAAHVKKRAAANESEARDLSRIGMLACIFGCDALYEDGYLGVQEGIVVGTRTVDPSSAIGRRIGQVRGRQVREYRNSSMYFDWHLKHVFRG